MAPPLAGLTSANTKLNITSRTWSQPWQRDTPQNSSPTVLDNYLIMLSLRTPPPPFPPHHDISHPVAKVSTPLIRCAPHRTSSPPHHRTVRVHPNTTAAGSHPSQLTQIALHAARRTPHSASLAFFTQCLKPCRRKARRSPSREMYG